MNQEKELNRFVAYCNKLLVDVTNNETQSLNEVFAETNRVIFSIDTERHFEEYTKDDKLKIKIPVIHDGQQKIWYLSKFNPVYRELLRNIIDRHILNFEVFKSGKGKDTVYTIIQPQPKEQKVVI